MLRVLASTVRSTGRGILLQGLKPVSAVPGRFSHNEHETDEEFDERFEKYFNRPDIDGWEIRKGINDLLGYDVVPDPKIICATLKACRRVSDYSLGVRFLEAVKFKCGNKVNQIYPYIIQEIQPTLDELGLDTPECLGYDKPELALVDVDDIH